MNDIIEPTMIGLSDAAHLKLKYLKDEGFFNEMLDAYRLGISLAIAKDLNPSDTASSRQTIFSVSTLDPNREIAVAVKHLCPNISGSIYKHAEKLAEAGVCLLYDISKKGEIDFVRLLNEK